MQSVRQNVSEINKLLIVGVGRREQSGFGVIRLNVVG